MRRFYRLLLKLYPARFREEFAAPLERQFADEYRETAGVGERARLCLRTLADLAVTIPARSARVRRREHAGSPTPAVSRYSSANCRSSSARRLARKRAG